MSLITTLKLPGESKLLVPSKEVVEIESAEQITGPLELIAENAIYD